MNKKELYELKKDFEFDCYLHDDISYLFMKYGFYVCMIFFALNAIFGISSIVTYIIIGDVFALIFSTLISALLSLLGAFVHIVGLVIFNIKFRQKYHYYKYEIFWP